MKFFVVVIALFIVTLVKAQPSVDIINYINTYKQLAMEEMQRTGIPASVKLAQGIHETYAGKSELVLKSNNHFGIKCKAVWTGQKVYHDDDARGECFRKYGLAADSYRDHSNFLRSGERYAFLFSLDPTDYKAWATGLRKAGYATNPYYAPIIIKLIEDYNLQQYTLIAMGRLARDQEIMAQIPKPATNAPSTDIPVIPLPDLVPDEIVEEIQLPSDIYPAGEFSINKTRAIFAKKGSSFLSLAREYNIPLSRIFEFNDLEEQDILAKDQLVFLQRKRKTGINEFHIMAKGENLYDVCQAEAVRMESVLEYNLLEKYMEPASGEKIYLHKMAPSRPMLKDEAVAHQTEAMLAHNKLPEALLQNQANDESFVTHIVQPSETLYGISRKYGIGTEKIKEWNKLEGADIKAGQQLVIYKN